jgi:uncharacterized membrane protein YphA (DoxX/SURF4 family)
VDATAQIIAGVGLPAAPFLAVVAGLVEVMAAVSIVTGFGVRWGALVLVLYLLPTTWLFHNPADAEQRINFLKNLAIMGGLITLYVYSPQHAAAPAGQPLIVPRWLGRRRAI